MNIKRIVGLALTGAFVAGGLVVSGGGASADIGDTDPLFQCASSGGADVGDAKFAPGLTTLNTKQTITATVNSLGTCSADEGDLDEIATSSKFGVTKTAAQGRLPVTGATAKAKFTLYGDCTGIIVPDGNVVGEYPQTYGTLDIQFTNGATKLSKSTVFGVLDATGGTPVITGFVTKGAGVGGTADLVAAFAPKTDGSDDFNGNMVPDFIDCAVSSDPTAKAKNLDVTADGSLDITI